MIDSRSVLWYNHTMDILKKYNARIIKSDRRTLAIEIGRDLSVTVRAPRAATRADIDRFLIGESGWIDEHIALMRQRNEEAEQRRAENPPFTAAEIKVFADRALEIIPERVAYFAPLVGVEVNGITVRNQRTRWGSCSAKGNLNFNCLLVLAPSGVLDYVVVHELCHRLEMNHSPRFWREVERVMPDYAERKKWLRENGGVLIERLKQK